MPRRQLSGGLVHTPMLEGLPNLITEPWRKQFATQSEDSNTVPAITRVSTGLLNEAIGTTPIPASQLSPGLYRVTAFIRIKAPAVSSSSVQLTIAFTDEADVCTFTGTAVTGNTPTTVYTQSWLVRIDASPISYAVAYASNGPAQMFYMLELILEQIG